MSNESDVSNTMYDFLRAMGKDAGFSYETIDTYIKDAQSANKNELVETWKTIKKDRLRHLHMLKEALEKEIHA
jgi:rubrerythrin